MHILKCGECGVDIAAGDDLTMSDLDTCRGCSAAEGGLISALVILLLLSVTVGGGVWATRVMWV